MCNYARTFAARLFAAALLLACAGSAEAAVRYVDVNSTNAMPPYLSWANAATNIQDAVDAAVAGDEIVVTNGIYTTGVRVVSVGAFRVAVDKPLTVRSVNGPQFTIIDGGHSVRCIYLANDASLSGFTVTGGVGWWSSGGGAYGGTLNKCALIGNAADYGGGAAYCTLNSCMLSNNLATTWGALEYDTGKGGGAVDCTLNNCALTSNRAYAQGGGAASSILNNCTLTGNTAAFNGGGASGGALNNCTLVGNFPEGASPHQNFCQRGNCGVVPVTLNNCIAYFNAPANYDSSSTLNYSCTTPLPTNGVGNITNEPAFVNPAAGNYRLRPDSPCIDAGTNLSASITNDLDGRPRPLDGNGDGLTAFDMGAYEYRMPLLVWQDSPNPNPPHADWASAAHTIQDAVDAAVAGDEIVVTNGMYTAGDRVADGTTNRVSVDKPLNLRSVNGPQFTIIDGGQSVRCVYLTNSASLSGFSLTNGRSFDGGGVLGGTLNNCTLTGNGAYSGGGAAGCVLNSCTLSGNSAVYAGGGASGCTLNNCALIGNSATAVVDPNSVGGGAASCTLNNCTLTGNSASGLYSRGGGAVWSTLNNCTLSGNSANGTSSLGVNGGGGAADCTLNNCTLTGNSATGGGGPLGGGAFGGGAVGCTLNNCVSYFNAAQQRANYAGSILNYSCTTPQPTNGVGNITNAPLFLDQAAGDLRLQSNSPCINAGLNTLAPAGPDLDGHPRIVGGTVDIGAYEYQSLSLINFGVVSNQFGFNITGQPNWVIVLEASSDFTNWTPLTTNTLGGSPFPFRDPTPPNLPRRFYRARQ